MDTAIQMMMGTSLAACVGLRAWLPMLLVGLLSRYGYVHLNPSYGFLARPDALVLFAIGAALELLGDKVIMIDHILDVIGTVVRPIVGTLVATSMLTHLDPVASLALGLMMGGGTSFTIHSGKAMLRAKSTVVAPLHGGAGNLTLSLLEDAAALGGTTLAVFAPAVAIVVTLIALCIAIGIIVMGVRTGTKLVRFFRRRSQAPPASH